MKKYCYNLGNKDDFYTIPELAAQLNLNETDLEISLRENQNNTMKACMDATNKKITRNNFDFLLNHFGVDFVSNNTINDTVNTYGILRAKKQKLIDLLEFSIKNEDVTYYEFNINTLNLLLFSTDENFKKPCYSNKTKVGIELIYSLMLDMGIRLNSDNSDALQTIFNTEQFEGNTMNKNSVLFTKNNVKDFLKLTKNHQLEKQSNCILFDQLGKVFTSDENANTILLVK